MENKTQIRAPWVALTLDSCDGGYEWVHVGNAYPGVDEERGCFSLTLIEDLPKGTNIFIRTRCSARQLISETTKNREAAFEMIP